MPNFSYRAVSVTGEIQKGIVVAAHERELVQALRLQRLELIEAKQKSANLRLRQFSGRNITAWQRIMVFDQTASMLASGLSLMQTLETVRQAAANGALRDALFDLIRLLRQGMPLVTACGSRPDLFNPMAVAMIAAGEASGNLALTFADLAEDHRLQELNRERAVRALRYPVFLLIIVLAVTSFLMMSIVPEIIHFLAVNGGTPTFLTRALIHTAGGVSHVWPWVLGGGTSLLVAVIVMRRTVPALRKMFDAALLSLPVIGVFIRGHNVERLMRTLATLYSHKVHLLPALALSRGMLTNDALRAILDKAIAGVRSGERLVAGLAPLLSPSAQSILMAGEGTGMLAKSFADIAQMMERDNKARLDKLLTTMEPVLTILMGAFLAWIIMAVLGPLYGSLANLKVIG